MEEKTLTFSDVCRYAELIGCKHRNEKSHAKDMTGKFFYSPWASKHLMVLYEGPKRTLRGHFEPEVCWWVIDCEANIWSEAARNLRMMKPARGLGITKSGVDKMKEELAKEDNNNGN